MKRRYKFKNIFFPALIFFIAIFSLFFILELANLNKIAYGLKMAGLKIGNASAAEAENILKENFARWENTPIIFAYQGQQFSILPKDLGIFLDLKKSVEQAYNFGRDKNILAGLGKQIKMVIPLIPKNILPAYSVDAKKFNQSISKLFSSAENPAQNASLLYDLEKRRWETTPSSEGTIFDRKKIEADIKASIANLGASPLELVLINDIPEVVEGETSQAEKKAIQILDNAPYAIKHNSFSWKIDRETLLDWITFIPIDENSENNGNDIRRDVMENNKNTNQNKILGILLSQEKISDVLTEIAPSINQEPINAELSFKDGKVSAFAISEDGLRLDIEKSAENINAAISNLYSSSETRQSTDEVEKLSTNSNNKNTEDKKTIKLIVIKKPPAITSESINALGLNALLGKGTSNFAGSPKNRTHNIKIGAAKINGIMIAPGEEFSFVKAIGEIGPKQGYLPELVIKHNKTVPEYGGGICQVSTTAFRAAVNSGLKIIERYPHAFPVKYYNPQGFDSTIYPPHPDLRFLNDTPKNILIQAKIEGTTLIFEFFGTADSREVKIKGPTILSASEDGSMKTILYQEIWRDGKMERQDKFFSNYKSPALYPVEKNPLE